MLFFLSMFMLLLVQTAPPIIYDNRYYERLEGAT